MKLILLSLLSVLTVSQAHARPCTTYDALAQASAAMKVELESDLRDQALRLLERLKAKVPSGAYARMQQYGKPLGSIEAVQIEAVLAQALQDEATALDRTSACARISSQLASIEWACYGEQAHIEIWANNGYGEFSVLVEREGGQGLAAPITFKHSVRASERYNQIETSGALREVVFPADKHGGNVVANDIRIEDLEGLNSTLAKVNQLCK